MSGTGTAARIAVVTGAARGLGAAIAVRLAADGLDVAVLDIDESRCAQTLEAVRALGRRAAAVAVDVSSERAVALALEQVLAQLGSPTTLINNAGVFFERMAHRTGLDDWNTVIDVNLRGTFLMSRAMHPFLKAQPGGRIVNIASVAAQGHLGQSAYSAAKAGIVGLTRTLAIEFGHLGATVNAVAPGFVLTEMTRATAERLGVTVERLAEDAAREVPVGRTGVPEDIANAVSFFVDPRAGFVSGQVLYVAGGPQS
jgi:3-oxoacyl-[acyl-carrier protein] reductase